MILVLGGACDAQIERALERLGPTRAARLDVRDLAVPGWQLELDSPLEGTIVVGGRPVPAASVSGVVVRRLAVYAAELDHVHEDDRDYAAAEMTALLAWWLTALPVPVLNRPARGALCGPFARPEAWLALAASIGLPVTPMIRTRALRPPPPPVAYTVTVVAGQAHGVSEKLRERAARLAIAAGADLMAAGFDLEGRLQAAHSFPPLDEETIDAIDRFISAGGCRAVPLGAAA